MGASSRSASGHRRFVRVMGVLVALGAIPMIVIVVLSGTEHGLRGPGTPLATVLAIVFACVPVIPMVAIFLWLDRYEPEPRAFVVLALGWGATLGCALALGLETLASLPLEDAGDELGMTVMAGLVAPFVEEATKGLFLVCLLIWCRNMLDGVLDGIVYGGLIGIGFAFTENILYLTDGYNMAAEAADLGAGGLTGTFILRGVFSPFAHPLFTIFLGIGIGIAVGARSRGVRVAAPIVGYLAAALAHMCWNGSVVFGIGGFLVMYAAIMVPALVGMVLVAVWAYRYERRVLTASLDDAAARGLIPYPDVDWMVDVNARRIARLYARQVGGPAAEHTMKEYQRTAVEFGFLHSRYLRGDPPPDLAERGREYVATIGAVRPRIAFPGQVVATR